MKLRFIFGLILIGALLCACATPAAKWTYPPPGGKEMKALHEKPPLPLKVAVLPFRERRLMENGNVAWVHIVPIMPYGWMNYNRPELAGEFMTVSSYSANPLEDYPQALVKALKEANLFQEVFFTYGADLDKADLWFTAELVSNNYYSKHWGWCVSVIGSEFAPLFGLPQYTIENELEINLMLKNPKAEKNLFSYTFSKNWSINAGFYYNRGRDMEGYPKMLQEGVHQAILALNEKIAKTPPDYWREGK